MKHPILSTLLYIFSALALLFVGSLPADGLFRVQAKAESNDYACVLREDVFFYASPDESQGLFLLPKSYYVKILIYETDYCRVEYGEESATAKRLIGYAKTDFLTFVDYPPQSPYFSYQFDLCYRIEEETPDGNAILNEITLPCSYYGDYVIGSKTYCYVLRGDTFGYVPKPADLTIPENPEYADYLAQKEKEEISAEERDDEPTSSPAQIAILIALCLLIPVLAALILKPPRRPPYETD